MSVDFSNFSYTWTCFIVLIIEVAMTAYRDLSIFVKINTFGVFFIAAVIVFIISVGVFSIQNTNYDYTKAEWEDDKATGEYFSYIPLV